jgi:hypothetical protein
VSSQLCEGGSFKDLGDGFKVKKAVPAAATFRIHKYLAASGHKGWFLQSERDTGSWTHQTIQGIAGHDRRVTKAFYSPETQEAKKESTTWDEHDPCPARAITCSE